MSKDFVAVGGTGQHVALALADLYVLAHSATLHPWPALRFTVVDADPASDDPRRPSAWSLAREQLGVLEAFPPALAGWPAVLDRKPFPDLPRGATTAAACVNELYGQGAAELLLAPRQHHLDVGTGYHGEPWVAAALTEQLLADLTGNRLPRQDALNQIRDGLGEADGRICVAGSAIGGTGAGVLPRLVQHFASHPNRRANVCAVIGLPWFQLDKPEGQNLDMEANCVSTLWHYRDTLRLAPYRLVLWGHPDVGSATREVHDGAARQGVKRDLTLPFHAAAAAYSFLVAGPAEVEAASGVYAPVPAPGGVALPEQLRLGDDTFGDLLTRNHRLMEILFLFQAYLQAPRPGPMMSFLRQAFRVRPLDALPDAVIDTLSRRVDGLLKAKKIALDRLSACATAAPVEQPTAPADSGFAMLRHYFQGVGKVEDLPGFADRIEGEGELPRVMNSGRVLPQRAASEVGFPDAASGTRAVVEGKQWECLAPLHAVSCSRIPDLRAPARLIDAVLTTRALWQVSGRGGPADSANPALVRSLFAGAAPVPPPGLQVESGDRHPAWIARWSLLLLGVVSGAVRVSTRPFGKDTVWYPVINYNPGGSDDGVPLGHLSDEHAVIPTPTAPWADGAWARTLANRVGRLGPLRGWLRMVRQVGECRFGVGSTPRWVEFLDEAMAQVPAADPGAYTTTRTLRVRWGDAVVQLPVLDANAAAPSQPLPQALCTAFGLPCVPVTEGDLGDPAVAAAWASLTAVTTRGVPVLPQAGSGWSKAARRDVAWIDRLDDSTRSHLAGELFLVPGAGKAYTLPNGAVALTVDRVLLPRLTLLRNGTEQPTVLWPIRGEFSGVVERREMSAQGDGTARITVGLRVGEQVVEVSRAYSRVEIDQVGSSELTLLLWPRVTTRPDGAVQLLLSPTQSAAAVSARVLFGRGRDLSDGSPWLAGSPNFHHLQPLDNGVTPRSGVAWVELQARHPDVVRILKGGEPGAPERGADPVPLGLWDPQVRARSTAAITEESWCIDLGTSSTVVAVARRGGDAETVSPTAARDATVVAALGVEELTDRKNLAWLPTYHRNRSAGLDAPFLPSQVVKLSDISPRPSYAVDWVLDHGEDLDPAWLNKVHDHFKWRSDPESRAYRMGFLRQVLEHAIEMENAAREQGDPLPAKLPVTFTLPIRQRGRLASFHADILEVARAVRVGTGVEVEPYFEWESSAVAPRSLNVEGRAMLVVADLGGGTLDLWAQLHEDGPVVRVAAESAYVGARMLVDMLLTTDVAQELAAAPDAATRGGVIQQGRRRYRQTLTTEDQVRVRTHKAGAAYYAVLCRLVAAWSSAVARAWDVQTPKVRLVLAGLGWSIGYGSEREVVGRLDAAANELGLNVKFEAERKAGLGGDDRARKTWLARNAARARRFRSINDLAALLEDGLVLENVAGIPTRAKPADARDFTAFGAETPLSTMPKGTMIQFDSAAIKVFLPADLEVDLHDAVDRLNQVEDATGQGLGCRSSVDGSLITSPLVCVAEAAVQELRRKYAPGIP